MKLSPRDRKLLAGLVGRFLRAMHRYDAGRMLPLVHAADLTLPQLAVLEYVEAPRSVSAVAEYLGLSRPASSQMVDKLVRRGWLRRSEGVADRRQRAVTLTGRGRVLLEKVHAARSARFEASLAQLPSTVAEPLRCALTQTLAKLEGKAEVEPAQERGRSPAPRRATR